MKFGLWLLIAVAAFLWFNHAKRQRNKQGTQRTPPSAKVACGQSAAASDTSAAGEQVVACAHCGLHVPRSDAVTAADGVTVYCSQAHRRLHTPA